MSFDYIDVHKLVKCVEHKKNLDAKYIKLKDWLVESCETSELSPGAFIFDKNTEGCLTLKLPVYKIELIFEDSFVIINDAPLLKLVATKRDGDKEEDIIIFYLAKNGLFYINEYEPNPSYDYDDSSLFIKILDATLKALKSKNKISL